MGNKQYIIAPPQRTYWRIRGDSKANLDKISVGSQNYKARVGGVDRYLREKFTTKKGFEYGH